MNTPTYDFSIVQGTDCGFRFVIKFLLANKCKKIFQRKDLTGYDFYFQVRKNVGDAETILSYKSGDDNIQYEVLNAMATVRFSHTVTKSLEPGVYVYEIKIKNAERNQIYKILSGNLTVIQEVASVN